MQGRTVHRGLGTGDGVIGGASHAFIREHLTTCVAIDAEKMR
jgi:hypothetical protein